MAEEGGIRVTEVFPRWLIGVLLYSFGAIMINLGSNLVKLGHTLSTAGGGPAADARGVKFRVGGWVLFAFGGFFNFFSFSFGAQSLLSSLAAIQVTPVPRAPNRSWQPGLRGTSLTLLLLLLPVQFVTNIFFGAIVNGEQLTPRIVAGTVVVIVGITVVIITGPKGETTYALEDLIKLYIEPPMVRPPPPPTHRLMPARQPRERGCLTSPRAALEAPNRAAAHPRLALGSLARRHRRRRVRRLRRRLCRSSGSH